MGWTQRELAEIVGVRRETIANLESGRYNPSLDLADRVAVSLMVSLDEIFDLRSTVFE